MVTSHGQKSSLGICCFFLPSTVWPSNSSFARSEFTSIQLWACVVRLITSIDISVSSCVSVLLYVVVIFFVAVYTLHCLIYVLTWAFVIYSTPCFLWRCTYGCSVEHSTMFMYTNLRAIQRHSRVVLFSYVLKHAPTCSIYSLHVPYKTISPLHPSELCGILGAFHEYASENQEW